MTDILEVTESQARVLRAIAHLDMEPGTKGGTQYSCNSKVPKEIRVSGSTFNDNISNLEEKKMVSPLEIKTGKRDTKPYTITDIGQVVWLRYFPILDNVEVIKKIFPNLHLEEIDDIINQIQRPGMKYLKNKFAEGILRIALNSFHIEAKGNQEKLGGILFVDERIELSTFQGNGMSFTRPYNVIEPFVLKKLKEKGAEWITTLHNFDELKINIIDRITFLFYYYLFQAIERDSSFTVLVKIALLETNVYKIINNKKIKILPNSTIEETSKFTGMLGQLSNEIIKKKKKILKVVSNKITNQIIQNNINNLKENNDLIFQEIDKMRINN